MGPFQTFLQRKTNVIFFIKRSGRWKLPLYKTPVPGAISFEDLSARAMLKFGTFYMRIEMVNEEKPSALFGAETAVKGYQYPGYLLDNMKQPELDEYEEARRKKLDKRAKRKELALHRKKILMQLMDREKILREEIKKEEEEIREEKLEKRKKELEDLLRKKKQELEDLVKEIEDQLKDKKKKKEERERKNRDRQEVLKQITNIRYGLKVKLVKLTGLSTFLRVRIVYGLFIDNEPVVDDLGDKLQFETDLYNKEGIKSRKKKKKKKAPKITVTFTEDPALFVKNVDGLVKLRDGNEDPETGKKFRVYIGFQLLLFDQRDKGNEDLVEEKDLDDPLADLPLPEPELVTLAGWTYWHVANSKKGLAASSKKQTVAFYLPPMLKLPVDLKPLDRTRIKLEFYCYKIKYNMNSLPYFAELRRAKEQKKEKLKGIEKAKYPNLYKENYIRNEEQQWTNKPFDKGSGIDVYIDECRFLPDNVTNTKVNSNFSRL